MLQKLKRFRTKIAAINIISMGIIFLIIFSLFYVVFESALKTQERALLLNTADIALKEGLPYDTPEREDFIVDVDEQALLFFVTTDLSGEILSFSGNAMMRRDFLEALLEDTDNIAYKNGVLENEHGDVRFIGDETFAYFISEEPDGRIYVFVSTETRDSVLRQYIRIAVGGLIVSVVCVFFISMYLASKAIVPIRDSLEKQEEFIADASHELRTPLAVIRSNVEMIIDEPDTTVQENMKWLSYILKESKRMTKITEDLLFLSKADIKNRTDDLSAEKEELNLSELVTGVYESFLKLFQEHNLLDNQSRIAQDIYIYANENQIRQLMTILIDNAIKYTKEGGVTVVLERDGQFACIQVTDTGQGIPGDMHDKIFERFVRTDKARSREAGGAGLGLSIARSIAEEHGGQVSVVSELGKGSTFFVVLPINNMG